MNRTDLANYLGISKARVSQILNDGEINFSIVKIVEIALKVNKFTVFKLKDKAAYLAAFNNSKTNSKTLKHCKNDGLSEVLSKYKLDSSHKYNFLFKQ